MSDLDRIVPHSTCRACAAPLLPALDLGHLHLSTFPALAHATPHHPRVPLTLAVCEACCLVQLTHTTPFAWMFGETKYWYLSGINETMIAELKDVVESAVALVDLKAGDVVIDIGANDGTLLSNLAGRGVCRVAYEPSTSLHGSLQQNVDILVPSPFPAPTHWEDYASTTRLSSFSRNPREDSQEQRTLLARESRPQTKNGAYGGDKGSDLCQAEGTSTLAGIPSEAVDLTHREETKRGDQGEAAASDAPALRNVTGDTEAPTKFREVRGVAEGSTSGGQRDLSRVQGTEGEAGDGSYSAVVPVPRASVHREQRAGTLPTVSQEARVERKPRQAKLIFACAVVYDLEEPEKFFSGVSRLLAADGIAVIQFQDLLQMIQSNGFDCVCHEHLEYYSLWALLPLIEAAGLAVLDVQTRTINGGSLRVTVGRSATFLAPAALAWLDREAAAGLTQVPSLVYRLQSLDLAIRHAKDQTLATLEMAIKRGGVVDLWGASTKANTLLQVYGIDSGQIRQAVERSPEKVGRYVGQTGIPIVSEETGRKDVASLSLVGPYQFRDSILRREAAYLKRGGQFLFPLPKVEVVTAWGEGEGVA